MIQKGLRVNIAKDVSTFYNDIVPFEHIFSSGFVSSSWFFLHAIISWELNEFLTDLNRPIRDWRGRIIPFPLDQFHDQKVTIEKTILTAPLVFSADGCKSEDYRNS